MSAPNSESSPELPSSPSSAGPPSRASSPRPRALAKRLAWAFAAVVSLGALTWAYRTGWLERPLWTRVTLGERAYLERGASGADVRAIVVVLHAYDTAPLTQERFFRVAGGARQKGWLVLLPEGLRDSKGKRYWNASPSCCGFDPHPPEDLPFLLSVLENARRRHGVRDEAPVFLLGVSNGAFMAHRLACEAGVKTRAVVTSSGTDIAREEVNCVHPRGASLLHLHGTKDETVLYEGGALKDRAPYLSAEALVRRWALRTGGLGELKATHRFHGDERLSGDDTQVLEAGGVGGATATLWRIEGGGHALKLTGVAREEVHRFLDEKTPR